MAEKATVKRARRDKRAGKAATTQAGEFVREEIHHIREGKHGARSTKQAIAIGLSKARRAGVKLGRPPSTAKAKTKRSAAYASRAGGHGARRASPRRSRAVRKALRPKAEPRHRARRSRVRRARRRDGGRRRHAAPPHDERCGPRGRECGVLRRVAPREHGSGDVARQLRDCSVARARARDVRGAGSFS